MRPYFIVNPVAGGGKARERFEKLLGMFGDEKPGFVYTDRAYQSCSLAEKAYAGGERFIVAVGGDGTINEVASFMYDKDDAVMGICPFGTGNDFARVVSMPGKPEEVFRVLTEGEERRVDVGLVNGRPFMNVCGLGFDVDVVLNTEKYKRLGGMAAYVMGVIKSMSHLCRIPLKITADGRVFEEKALLAAVGNGSHYGGGMAVLPMAKADDGFFDVCIIRGVGLFRFLTLLPSFIKGKHIGKKQMLFFRAKEVEIECERRPVQFDGELGEYAPMKAVVLPGALRMMLPARE